MNFSTNWSSAKSPYHTTNEDHFFLGKYFVIVADGMGGEGGGDIASKLAVKSIEDVLKSVDINRCDESAVKDLMFSAIDKADSAIMTYVDTHPDLFGMGTTVLLMVHKDDRIFVAWCGDSRCYLYREGSLVPLTKDHSYVRELLDEGTLTEEEAFTHPENNVITRFAGGGPGSCIPEFVSKKVNENDILILCSDGLSGYCRNEEITQAILACGDMRQLSESLRALALKRGSDDDITIIVCKKKMRKPFWR